MNEEKKLNAEALDKVAGGDIGIGLTCKDCKNNGSMETCPCWTNADAVFEIAEGSHPLCGDFVPMVR